jgi:hypothetical protein
MERGENECVGKQGAEENIRKKLHNEGLQKLCSSPDIIRVIK